MEGTISHHGSKSHPVKVQLARRLRKESTMTLKWIAARLRMGSWTYGYDALGNHITHFNFLWFTNIPYPMQEGAPARLGGVVEQDLREDLVGADRGAPARERQASATMPTIPTTSMLKASSVTVRTTNRR